MFEDLKLGIIGASEGNGHPYSWSAIFNGYDKKIMDKCEYSAIPNYLNKQTFPDAQIKNARVTHIWTQDNDLSHNIASAALIDNVVNDYNDFIGNVDAVILARDDAENHFEIASSFLKAGIPIYIDKPFALSVAEAKKIINLQKYKGQIFSCSSMRYSSELKLSKDQKKIVGEIISIYGFFQKSWDKYAVHIIEPIVQLIPNQRKILKSNIWKTNDKVKLSINFESGVDIHMQTCGKSPTPLNLKVIGSKGCVDLNFTDSFAAFKSTLIDFIEGVRNRDVRIPSDDIIEIVKIIELGRGV